MKKTKDNPGVFVPPPLFYAAFFLFSILLQGYFPIRSSFFHDSLAYVLGVIIIVAGLIFTVPAVRQFIKTHNTVVTVKSATSLQTSGIYAVTRNPMYTGLILEYLGLALIFGNWWTIILLPVLIISVSYLVILPEERYLTRAFGDSYTDYKNSVRRWI